MLEDSKEMDGVTIDTNQQAKIATKGSGGSDHFYAATLPDEFQEMFDLEEGSTVITSLERSSVEGEEYRYVEITWPTADEDTETDGYRYTIRHEDERYIIRFYPDWTRENKDSPFYQIEEGDKIFVELNELDPAIRVFRPEDASLRNKELGLKDTWPSFKEIIIGTAGELLEESGYTDLSKHSPYKGQKFDLIPFDAQNDIFSSDDSDSGSYTPSINIFQDAREQGQLPQRSVRKLIIKWSPEAAQNYHDNNWTGRIVNGSDQKIIYIDYLVNETKVILPCTGEFEISTVTEYGQNQTWLTCLPSGPENHQRRIDDNWFSKYHKTPENEEAIIVYIPCNSQ